MADVKWIKIVPDIFDDDKIKLIESMPDADAIIVLWFKLLCLAGRTNANGVLLLNDKIAYTDEMLATIFRRKLSTVKLALATFEQFGMIEIVGNVITIPNWDKHQNADRLTELREYNRIAKQKSRAKQKLLADVNDKSMTSQSCQDTDIDIEEDKDRDKKKIKKKKQFTPPTLEEVQAYCKQRNNSVDPKEFFDYYDVSGWIDKKGDPVHNWKQKVIMWERNNKPKNGTLPTTKRDTSLDDIF